MKQKVSMNIFFFNGAPNDRMESLSSENTRPAPAPGPAQGLASGASIVAPADITIFDKNMIISDESGISNEDDRDLWTWQLLAVHSVCISLQSCLCERADVCVCVCVSVCV